MNKKYIFTVLVATILNTLSAQEGVYFTENDYKKDSINYQYTFAAYTKMNGGSISLLNNGKIIHFSFPKVFAVINKKNDFIIVDPILGPQKLFIEGELCLFGHIFDKFYGRGGEFPELQIEPKSKFYFSNSKTGKLEEANIKNLKPILKDEPELIERYKKNKNIVEIVILYNKKHPKTNDRIFYYQY